MLIRHVATVAAIAALLGPVSLAQAQSDSEMLRGGATKKGGSDRSRGRRSSATAAMAPYPPRRSYRDFVPSLIVSSPKLVSRRFALSKFFATEICPKRNTVRRVTPRQQSLGHFWQRCVIYDRSSRCLSPNATTGRSIEYDAVTNPYCSRRSDHGVHPSARELAEIADLLPYCGERVSEEHPYPGVDRPEQASSSHIGDRVAPR